MLISMLGEWGSTAVELTGRPWVQFPAGAGHSLSFLSNQKSVLNLVARIIKKYDIISMTSYRDAYDSCPQIHRLLSMMSYYDV